jgi:hypothetical protein
VPLRLLSRALLVCAALQVSTSTFAAEPISSSAEQHAFAGDVLLIGLPVAALGLTFFITEELVGDDDASSDAKQFLGMNVETFTRMNGRPRHDLLLALGRTLAVSYTLKYTVSEERPNGEDEQSFPSGHTAVTFTGAEFIRKEFGWGWGTPAYLAASYVGFTRVHADKHYAWDVLAGAAIGILANHDLHRKLTGSGALRIGPTFTTTRSILGTPWREENVTTFAPAPSIGLEYRFGGRASLQRADAGF